LYEKNRAFFHELDDMSCHGADALMPAVRVDSRYTTCAAGPHGRPSVVTPEPPAFSTVHL
jgi:hypothetical protein